MGKIENLVEKDTIYKDFICPRCGSFGVDLKRGALSRYADVHICSACGTKEALDDLRGLSFDENTWFICKRGNAVKG